MLNEKDFPPLPSLKVQKRAKIKLNSQNIVPPRNDGVPASINELPDELILEILDYFPALDLENFHLLTLVNLSLVNRRLHSIVSDRLYTGYDSFFCAPYPFLRTVIAKPELAKFVQSVRVSYGPGIHAGRKRYEPTVDDKRTIKDGMKLMEIPGWKPWASDCNDEEVEQEILYATILMYTPNIVELAVDDGIVTYKIPKWLDLMRWSVNGSHFGRVHHFLHLKTICVTDSNLKLRHLAPIFKLPALKTTMFSGVVELAQIKEGKPEVLQRLLPVGTSPVEDLSFLKSFIHKDILAVLLRCFRSLKRFELYNSGQDTLDPDGGELHWVGAVATAIPHPTGRLEIISHAKLIKSLDRYRYTLERLCIRDVMLDDDLYVSPGPLGSLRQFERLSRLDIPFSALFNIHDPYSTGLCENLPPAMTSIVIFIDSNKYSNLEALTDLARRSSDLVPLLKEVTVDIEDSCTAMRNYNWQHLRCLWAETDVRLVVRHADEEDNEDFDFPWIVSSGNKEDTDTESESESDEESLYSD